MQGITGWLKRYKFPTIFNSKKNRIGENYKLQVINHLPSINTSSSISLRDYYKKSHKTRKLVQLSSIALLSLPAKSVLITQDTSTLPLAYDNVIASNTLILASVPGDSTFFATDGFKHGFGYDLARAYADELGVNIHVAKYDNAADALTAVSLGEADIALTTASTLQTQNANLAALNISCGFDAPLQDNGLHPKTSWSFRSSGDPLAIKASQFLCDTTQLQATTQLAQFYDQTLLKDDYNRKHFEETLAKNLPDYQSSFEKQADTYNHDWELLVAMGYQESHLNANAVSPTGVRGLMMLTSSTAKAMGVSNRVDPYQSIGGGARYLEEMKESFSDVPNPDRLWFSLASYNMGPNAIKRVQKQVEQQGLDPNNWTNVYTYMVNNKSSNSRYTQCIHYVTNIRTYLETLKTQTT